MTLVRAICFVLISSGGILTTYTTIKYHKMLRYNRAERYGGKRPFHRLETISELTFVFFIVGYAVGATHVLFWDVENIYLFIGFVFFIASLFLFAMINVLISLEDSLRAKTMEVMLAFVNSIEMKDSYTQGHSWHVYHLSRLLYNRLPQAIQSEVSEPKLLDAALLHDIGKIGVNNRILNEKGPLTDEDWAEIKSHPSIGKKMLENTCFAEIGDWVCYHHERMDGRGYYGLPGNEIPIASRIIAIADTYSAITTNREYRPRRSHETAIAIMKEAAGSQFDADLVRYFCTITKVELDKLSDLVWKDRVSENIWTKPLSASQIPQSTG